MRERWREAPGFDRYEVSDAGRVRNKKTGLVLKPQWVHSRKSREIDGRNHKCVRLYRSGLPAGANQLIHRLVLLAFRGEPPDGYEGCHRDGDETNNALSNLRWGTQQSNQADRVAHGTSNRGERHPRAVLCEADVIDIREKHRSGRTVASIAREIGVCRTTVSAAANNATWKHVQPNGGQSSL